MKTDLIRKLLQSLNRFERALHNFDEGFTKGSREHKLRIRFDIAIDRLRTLVGDASQEGRTLVEVFTRESKQR